MSLLLDTTVLIDVLRGRPAAGRVRALAERAEAPWICAVNVEEVVHGVRPGEEPAVREFLAGLRLAPLGRAEGQRAGAWRRRYGARGTTLSQADCLIAAAAVGVGAVVATGNARHFPMPEVRIEHWPVGE